MRRLCALGALVVALGAGACGSSTEPDASSADRSVEGESLLEGTTAPCTPPVEVPTSRVPALLPSGVTLPATATVIAVVDEPTHVTLTAQIADGKKAENSPSKLKERYAAELRAAGYEITGDDDEGHESEVHFAFDDGRKGTVQSVRSKCPPDSTRVIVSYTRS
jgi:hypothetical protein